MFLCLITLVTLVTLYHQLAHMLKFLDTLIKFIIIIIMKSSWWNLTLLLFISQTPSASHEIMLISKEPCKDLFQLFFDCLAGKSLVPVRELQLSPDKSLSITIQILLTSLHTFCMYKQEKPQGH